MWITNAQVLCDDFTFRKADLEIEGTQIKTIDESCAATQDKENSLDAKGQKVIPGLLDIHTHGCDGIDTCDGNIEGYHKMAKYYANNGITSYLATTMSIDTGEIDKICTLVHEFSQEGHEGAYLHGIYMEGPFFSKQKCGAQDPKYIINPDIELFRKINADCGGFIKTVAVAPELDGAMEFIDAVKDEVLVTIAHTMSDYDTAVKAMKKGVHHVTHLFNAMPAFTHREPGVVGAIFEDNHATAELICDGIHIHPAVIRTVFKTLGYDRVCLISDSMCAAGLPDGKYHLGGQEVFVKDGAARLANGALAGSSTNLFKCMRNVHRFGIPFEMAVKAASLNPARAIGVDNVTGSIKEGKNADLVVLDENLDPLHVFVRGTQVK